MHGTGGIPAPGRLEAGPGSGLVLASRGDALTPYLLAALQRRYPVTGRLDPELRPWQRVAVAQATFRPSRVRWAEQFHKSGLGYPVRAAALGSAARRRVAGAFTWDHVVERMSPVLDSVLTA